MLFEEKRENEQKNIIDQEPSRQILLELRRPVKSEYKSAINVVEMGLQRKIAT